MELWGTPHPLPEAPFPLGFFLQSREGGVCEGPRAMTQKLSSNIFKSAGLGFQQGRVAGSRGSGLRAPGAGSGAMAMATRDPWTITGTSPS